MSQLWGPLLLAAQRPLTLTLLRPATIRKPPDELWAEWSGICPASYANRARIRPHLHRAWREISKFQGEYGTADTTVRLNETRGSEQYHLMNSSMACL
jgi:hypothetical protein